MPVRSGSTGGYCKTTITHRELQKRAPRASPAWPQHCPRGGGQRGGSAPTSLSSPSTNGGNGNPNEGNPGYSQLMHCRKLLSRNNDFGSLLVISLSLRQGRKKWSLQQISELLRNNNFLNISCYVAFSALLPSFCLFYLVSLLCLWALSLLPCSQQGPGFFMFSQQSHSRMTNGRNKRWINSLSIWHVLEPAFSLPSFLIQIKIPQLNRGLGNSQQTVRDVAALDTNSLATKTPDQLECSSIPCPNFLKCQTRRELWAGNSFGSSSVPGLNSFPSQSPTSGHQWDHGARGHQEPPIKMPWSFLTHSNLRTTSGIIPIAGCDPEIQPMWGSRTRPGVEVSAGHISTSSCHSPLGQECSCHRNTWELRMGTRTLHNSLASPLGCFVFSTDVFILTKAIWRGTRSALACKYEQFWEAVPEQIQTAWILRSQDATQPYRK